MINLCKSINYLLIILVIFSIVAIGCVNQENDHFETSSKETTVKLDYSETLHELNKALELDIVHDFFSPPVASRVYLYPNIAVHEVFFQNTDFSKSLQNLRADIPQLPEITKKELTQLASFFVFCKISKTLIYTSENIAKIEDKLRGLILNSSDLSYLEDYAEQCAQTLLDWMKKDGYPETRNMKSFELSHSPGSWQPTPPDYMDALEPNWHTIKPFLLDSASLFRLGSPPTFSLDKNSIFYGELMDVYNYGGYNAEEDDTIAKYWDCNPFVINHDGHVSYANKKLTPGGHWLSIARIVAIKEKLDFEKTVTLYTYLTIGIFDSFISCWESKYHYNYIRPITVIKEHINSNWNAKIVNPNFPEYPSGHSVVSRTSAEILTYLIGDSYQFTDNSEVPYGLGKRTFQSFFEASDEAAISRLRGGIHFMSAIDSGRVQGHKIGTTLIDKIKLLNDEL